MLKETLKWLIAFLDRKFPDVLEVRAADYLALESKISGLVAQSTELAERLEKLEKSVNVISFSVGLSGPKVGMLER